LINNGEGEVEIKKMNNMLDGQQCCYISGMQQG